MGRKEDGEKGRWGERRMGSKEEEGGWGEKGMGGGDKEERKKREIQAGKTKGRWELSTVDYVTI